MIFYFFGSVSYKRLFHVTVIVIVVIAVLVAHCNGLFATASNNDDNDDDCEWRWWMMMMNVMIFLLLLVIMILWLLCAILVQSLLPSKGLWENEKESNSGRVLENGLRNSKAFSITGVVGMACSPVSLSLHHRHHRHHHRRSSSSSSFQPTYKSSKLTQTGVLIYSSLPPSPLLAYCAHLFMSQLAIYILLLLLKSGCCPVLLLFSNSLSRSFSGSSSLSLLRPL